MPVDASLAGVTLGDLGSLTLRGNVAYAARCARRVRPLFRLPADAAAHDARIAAIDAALQVAADFAHGEEVPAGLVQGVAAAAYEVAEDVHNVAGYAGYAAAHAARAVFGATRASANADATFVEVIASTFGASRVLLANCGSADERLVLAALRADFEALLRLRLGRPGEPGEPVDVNEAGPLGPLWPAGAPPWAA
jgi:hypothetical protein